MNTLKNLLRKGITIGSFCLVSGTILSAQISLSMQNKSTREVIREIEKVSDYRFFYNDNLSGLNTKISVSAQGEYIRDVPSVMYLRRPNRIPGRLPVLLRTKAVNR